MKLHQHLVATILSLLRDIMCEGRPAEHVIAAALKAHPKWGSRDRRLVTESVYEIIRHWRRFWRLAGMPDTDFLNPSALVDEALGIVWQAWWINSRGAAPEISLPVRLDPKSVAFRLGQLQDLAIIESIPDWIDLRGRAAFANRWPALLHALNQPADVFLRTNRLKISRDDLQKRLLAEGVATETVAEIPDGLRLLQRQNLAASAAFREGLFEIQDAASQQIAPMLAPKAGETVIDVCAGAGGKTLHLASLMENRGQIIAMDTAATKLETLQNRCRRNGVTIAETRLLTGASPPSDMAGLGDAVLLDVPCSGLGVLRRLPDTKWKLTSAELCRLTALQAELLQNHSSLAKPGGRLAYATCSILPEENAQQIATFLASPAGQSWKLQEERHIFPDKTNADGFYGALLVRAV